MDTIFVQISLEEGRKQEQIGRERVDPRSQAGVDGIERPCVRERALTKIGWTQEHLKRKRQTKTYDQVNKYELVKSTYNIQSLRSLQHKDSIDTTHKNRTIIIKKQ